MTWTWVPIHQHWGIHGCLLLFDPLVYQLLNILRSDNCVAIVSLIIFFTLSVFKVVARLALSASFLQASFTVLAFVP